MEVGTGEGGQDTLLEPNSSFGEIAILCNIPQPYTVRIDKPCKLLRVDKQSFSNILQIYVSDRQTILRNLLGVIAHVNCFKIEPLNSILVFDIFHPCQ